MRKPHDKNKKGIGPFIRYSTLGFEMMSIIALGTFLGYKLDDWIDNEFRIFTLSLAIFSVIISILYAVRNLLKRK